MSKFKEGTKVIVINDGEARRGVIRIVYDYIESAIVDMEDGTTEKVYFASMAVDRDEPNNEAPESEIKSKLPTDEQAFTITYGEFKSKAIDFIKNVGLDQEDSLTLAHIFGGFAAILFKGKSEND